MVVENRKLKTKVTSKVCGACEGNKRLDDYYSSSSYINKGTGKLSVCKKCLWDYTKPEQHNSHNLATVKDALRMVDRPFIQSMWDASVEEVNRGNGNSDYFKIYMKNIAMKDFKDLTWSDSEFEVVNKDGSVTVSEELAYSESDMKNLRKFWGEYNVTDYIFLEEFFGEYMSKFPKDTPAAVNIYKGLAKIHLQAEKELALNNIKNYKDLMDLSSKMHADGNIKPTQSSGMDESKMSMLGLWIKDIEKYEPCEYFEDKPLYKDYDSFKVYIDKWLLRPMKNIFGVGKDFDVNDDNLSDVKHEK